MAEYKSISNDFEVSVFPQYIPEQSSPEQSYYFFTYKIKLVNQGTKTAQLMTRHWIIVDGQRRVQEVKGDGVVGQQPVLKPGESFEYSSFCPLPTPTGNMRGSFQMEEESGGSFDIEVPVFFLRDLKHDQ